MGTLFNQRPREYRPIVDREAEKFIEWVGELSKRYSLPPESILRRLEVFTKLAEVNFKYSNADVWDEQIGGLGKIAEKFVNTYKDASY